MDGDFAVNVRFRAGGFAGVHFHHSKRNVSGAWALGCLRRCLQNPCENQFSMVSSTFAGRAVHFFTVNVASRALAPFRCLSGSPRFSSGAHQLNWFFHLLLTLAMKNLDSRCGPVGKCASRRIIAKKCFSLRSRCKKNGLVFLILAAVL